MKAIKTTNEFFKDLKKHGFSASLIEVLNCLSNDLPLPEKFKDHQLKGKLKQYRECHVKPDLLLVYEVLDDDIKLVALDSHSNLFKN
ncbi:MULTISPECIES: type II toxin-antitoxin system YafQ family toxin [unclassified Moraxella]|uniref:type II toxin-antitoxin system YafQ family toxin n=1 Tax=unclassified Moraxella TaxID=2685852 RepID=UPI003AF7AB2A